MGIIVPYNEFKVDHNRALYMHCVACPFLHVCLWGTCVLHTCFISQYRFALCTIIACSKLVSGFDSKCVVCIWLQLNDHSLFLGDNTIPWHHRTVAHSIFPRGKIHTQLHWIVWNNLACCCIPVDKHTVSWQHIGVQNDWRVWNTWYVNYTLNTMSWMSVCCKKQNPTRS